MEIVKTKIASSKSGLAATIHLPENKMERLAILCPGYLDSKDYRNLVSLAEALSGRGYTAVRFDPTGTWESEGDISDYTVTQYLEDIKHVFEYMLQRADYEDVLLGGHSLGGAVSLLYAALDPRISTVVGVMPPARIVTGERRERWKEMGSRVSQRDLPNDGYRAKEFRVPYSYAEDSSRYNVVQEVKKITSPVVLLAGELDDVVPQEEIKEIFENAHEPKRFAIVPGIGHDYRRRDEEIESVNKTVLDLVASIHL